MFTNFEGKNISSISWLQVCTGKYVSAWTQCSACAWEELGSLCAPLHWHSQISAPPAMCWGQIWGTISSKLRWRWLPSGAGFGKERDRQLRAATSSASSVKSACSPQLETSSSPHSYEHFCIPACPYVMVGFCFSFSWQEHVQKQISLTSWLLSVTQSKQKKFSMPNPWQTPSAFHTYMKITQTDFYIHLHVCV